MTAQESYILRLRRQRERNDISLEDLAVATRVSRELLEAFERNDLSEWPSGLYARSIVRAYATVVGVDPTATVGEFCRLFPQGDRRAGGTLQEMAAIVAHSSEYVDEFDGVVDRRRHGTRPHALPARRWFAGFKRTVNAVLARIFVFKPRTTS